MAFFDKTLKNLFGWFLKTTHTTRHFGRGAAPVGLPTTGPTGSENVSRAMRRVAADDIPAAIVRTGSHEDGLSQAIAEKRLQQVGPNEVAHEKPLPWWRHLWLCYQNPFNLLLTVLALISWATQDVQAAVIIGSMVALSTLIRFVQEGRSNRAADRLKAMVSNTATVLRRSTAADGGPTTGIHVNVRVAAQPQELRIRELVPGDHIVLSAGDMIPADCRILKAKDLFVSQAAMTGESVPVEKFASLKQPFANEFDATNLVFMGTNVVSGSATALVVSTGNQTYFGTLSSRVTAGGATATAFQLGVNSVSWLLIRFALIMVPIVLLINGFTKGDWTEAFLFALSVAVGLTPEMLPMIVTSTLAKGAVVLSRQKVVVKRLDAIQNFGAMDVLCTDKTGTLTQDKIALSHHTDAFGAPCDEVLHYACLNSHFQTGLKNLLDHAVLAHAHAQPGAAFLQDYVKLDEVPFDFSRRRMSVIVAQQGAAAELICKGAVEEILSVCTHVRVASANGDERLPLDAEMLARVRTITAEQNRLGLRVVAVAVKTQPSAQAVYGVEDECGLTLVGYIAFFDPPKESTQPALEALSAHGVQVKVLTGDNEMIAQHVCAQVGMAADAPILLGPQIERMDAQELAQAAQKHQIFARLTPLHKERVVHALRTNGHVVGFLGDGINDAPALRAADIGISVDSGVDIAKEAADIILLEKSLMVLEEGVIEGRKTFCNMLKYIRMTASSNFGNVFSVLVGSAFLPFLPMLPIHLLTQNLLYDISQTAIPFDNVDAESVQKPLRWNPADIGRFMLFFGPISSIFDILTYCLMWFVFGAMTVQDQTLFQSGWFVVGLLTQTLIVHLIRTPKIPFLESRASWPLCLMTVIIMAIGIILPMSPLASAFNLQALPPSYFIWLVAILVGYAALTSAMKRFYIRKFGW